MFNPKVLAFRSQLSTEWSHPLWWYIFPQGKTPGHMWCLQHLCMFFPRRENCSYFTTISFYKTYSGSVLMSNWYLHSDPLSVLDFVGSALTQFIYFTLSKNCGFVHYQEGTWILTTVFWQWLGFSPHVLYFAWEKVIYWCWFTLQKDW